MQSTKPLRTKPANWPAQSPHTVLIRNLQLLQFDRLEDWPGITPRTLASSSQNQRQRIKAIEWVLYHLVAKWDPEVARDKLRPFFPPLEPLQSVNLRAALFRVLSDLKKNGDLGRETILRKSMLDDCKGDKLDELLAVFSTAVLRKHVISSPSVEASLAVTLSLAPVLSHHEYSLLLPLILAHRVSLKNQGERRERMLATHEKFLRVLEDKKAQIESRATGGNHVSLDPGVDLDGLAREIKANWQGSLEWADTLLYGGAPGGHDSFFDLPFDTAWTRAKASAIDQPCVATPSSDLLLDLEFRVLKQRSRLQRWRHYSAALRTHKRSESTSSTGAPKRDPQLLFREHQALTVASISKAVRQPIDREPPAAKDQSILLAISEAMAQINGPSQSKPPQPQVQTQANPIDAPEPEVEQGPEPEPERSPMLPYQIPTIQTTQPNLRMNTPEELNDESSVIPGSLSESLSPVSDRSPEIQLPPDEGFRYTLVERTRKSMSLIPPPRESPHPRSRAARVSFPVNQFETPPKSHDIPSRASTPRDELFDDQADYASVFKSRPRVALSPVASPAVHFSPIGNFDLGTDVDLEPDLDLVGIGSPLASRLRKT